MNQELLKFNKKEINDFLTKGITGKLESPWSYSVFHVNKNAKIEQGTLRLIINYKPLNKAL